MKDKKYKILALFGKSGAGKDTIQNWIVSTYPDTTHKVVSTTTRPPRDYEVHKNDYNFLSFEAFGEAVMNGEMLEATSFKNNFYGTKLSDLDIEKINIAVVNPEGILALLDDSRLEVIPVYVHASDKSRLLRILNREKNPDCAEICRRYFADEEDFINIDFSFDCWLNEDYESYENGVYDSYFNRIIIPFEEECE